MTGQRCSRVGDEGAQAGVASTFRECLDGLERTRQRFQANKDERAHFANTEDLNGLFDEVEPPLAA